jgi:hypothetical protein
MNRIVASAGVLMVGMAGVDAANVTGLTPQEMNKWWSVSASLKGFYDDNIFQTHKKESSPGLEVEPSFAVNFPLEQTLISAKYLYRLRYYTDRPGDDIDQDHEFSFRLNHRFSERYTLTAADYFVYSNEPEIVDQGGVVTTFDRTDSTGVRNRAPIDFHARLTRILGVLVGYENAFYDYKQDGDSSLSALLDRVEHVAHVDVEYYFTDTTVGFVGYQFGFFDYTSDDLIAFPPPVKGSERSRYSHVVYVGGSHKFSERLFGSARGGVEYTDYKQEGADSDFSPYFDLNATYIYLPGCIAKAGVKVTHAATDLVGTDPTDVTRDQLAAAFYANVSHKITSRITGHWYGQYQFTEFNGGSLDGENEGFLNTGVQVVYQISNNFAANAAYSFDWLSSDIPNREFNRNRVWAGVTVTY